MLPRTGSLNGMVLATFARLMESSSLSKEDQMAALDARVHLWKTVERTNNLPRDRQQAVLKNFARILAQRTDNYAKPAVVPAAGRVLASAGLVSEFDALLQNWLAPSLRKTTC